MNGVFQWDVFLSYSSKDKDTVRAIAHRLKRDGLRVWFDEAVLRPGDSIPSKIEDGLENSRVLVLCMSANAFGSQWAQLESYTFRFRDPLNGNRQFIPLRLDDSPVKGSLAQFLYIQWRTSDEQQYKKLVEACRPPMKLMEESRNQTERLSERTIRLEAVENILQYQFNPNRQQVLSCGGNIKVWNLATGECLREFGGAMKSYDWAAAWSSDGRRALSGGRDGVLRLWDVENGQCVHEMNCGKKGIHAIAWPSHQHVAVVASGRELEIWDIEKGRNLGQLRGHEDDVHDIAWAVGARRIISGSKDGTVRLWDVFPGRCVQVLEGHTGPVRVVAWASNEHRAISGSGDGTIRLWDTVDGRCLIVIRAHTQSVRTLAWSADCRYILSGSNDNTAKVWDAKNGRCLLSLAGHRSPICSVAWSVDQRSVLAGDTNFGIMIWDVQDLTSRSRASKPVRPLRSFDSERVLYTNAKVLLVGESGVGKTGLSRVLSGSSWQASDSTVGAWATQLKLPVSSVDETEREIWLWDFGGQADQRLIHQLYMEDTALAVLVFDGQKEDLFETLGQWDRDLARASQKPFTKVLAAGRVDAGGLRVSRAQINAFVKGRNFACFVETSAKANLGCDELKDAILCGIRWADIPWRSSPVLFKRLKDEIIRIKDEGRVLMRFNELRDALRLRLTGEAAKFRDEELKAVVGLLTGPGVLWELQFGSWLLLQPERINAYAQAVIQTMRQDEYERGAIYEEKVLHGDLAYQSSAERLNSDDERFVLLAMHQLLVERGLCLREHTDKGPLLIFPSYYRRERPELAGHPAVMVSYQFNGFLDDIYATLVVRLHHTQPFQQDKLWRYAADFKTLTGRQLGLKMNRHAEGSGELQVYFDPDIPVEERIIFSRYVHEHVQQKASDVVRLRHYVCPHCGTPVGNREVAMERLQAWLEAKMENSSLAAKDAPEATKSPTILCVRCEKRVPLWDEMEERFASRETREKVRSLQEQSAIILDNESKERALVGEVISTVALAGQISREFNVSDHGIDMEIEFKNDAGEATGKKVYLQLKSGDSYLRVRKGDGVEIFEIQKERYVEYWMSQAFPVMLVIRNAGGEVRSMEVRDWLKQASQNGKIPIKQIVFDGMRFDVMGVRQWRDIALGKPI